MKVEAAGESVLKVTAARPELAAIIAGARMANRLLEEDPSAPPDARAALGHALAGWDAALARLESGHDT